MEKSRLGFLQEINFKMKNFWGIFYFIVFELFYVSFRGKTFHQFMVESALKFNSGNLFIDDKFAIFVPLLTFEGNLEMIFDFLYFQAPQ
jgi:hypothetical protein